MEQTQNKKVQKPDASNSAEKEQYLLQAAAFAASVAAELKEPDAEKIFCPAFKVKACGCIQRFITGGDGNFPSDGAVQRAADLLYLHQEARRLKSKISTDRTDKGDKRVLRMLRAEGFERFIIANRARVRQEMGICERACQRLLFYSNNFLHKDLKTGPEKGPRIKRMGGKKLPSRDLRPIPELVKETCCPNRCANLILAQYKLVESWRKISQTSKQGMRRVIDEMLSDDEGQSNCHKFITMITGCSFPSIYKAKECSKRNKEPRAQSSSLRHSGKHKKKTPSLNNEDSAMVISGIGIVPASANDDKGYTMAGHHSVELPNDSHSHNHHHQQKPDVHTSEVQYHIEQQPTFNQFIQSLSAVNPNQVTSMSGSCAESPPQSHTLTVLAPATSASSYASTHPHFQFMENHHHHHPQMLISVPEALQGQAISVITTPSSLDPLASNPFGNVVLLPESTLFMPGTQFQGNDNFFRTVL